jgi:hypothetical protein
MAAQLADELIMTLSTGAISTTGGRFVTVTVVLTVFERPPGSRAVSTTVYGEASSE